MDGHGLHGDGVVLGWDFDMYGYVFVSSVEMTSMLFKYAESWS